MDWIKRKIAKWALREAERRQDTDEFRERFPDGERRIKKIKKRP